MSNALFQALKFQHGKNAGISYRNCECKKKLKHSKDWVNRNVIRSLMRNKAFLHADLMEKGSVGCVKFRAYAAKQDHKISSFLKFSKEIRGLSVNNTSTAFICHWQRPWKCP